ncbi:hypothetical protein CYLTODRAFT_421056 [Cylindrobasidium torrendii FP15055 ss-10]|uniref:SGF29 C-terminal domain-containing protein n=1 Tax=Cylindrobasidium torrendii FP15055 ss-10 TaxID=1314674 RepID=A0A0D7BF26_9AGAR|nr:hypothetical protein CYLTODRAFT_421056 [Cylindrobasidium torrendii FP15055 ss-10]
MDRRRGIQARPAASEEMQMWSQARAQLIAFTKAYMNPATPETLGRVNRLIAAWPTDDTVPSEGLDDIKQTQNRLRLGLHEIENNSEKGVKMIDTLLEKLDILIALRTASETPPAVLDKRNKRPHAASPPQPLPPPGPARGPSITLPPRNTAGTPLNNPTIRVAGRKDHIQRQLPLQKDRKVAFHPPPKAVKDEGESSDWILASIVRCVNQEKNKYEVRDADEESPTPAEYITTLKSMIPLPDPAAFPGSPSSLDAYPQHREGATVLALYPDTSCFYRAKVLAGPTHNDGHFVTYTLIFEDDGAQQQVCPAHFVVEAPKE